VLPYKYDISNLRVKLPRESCIFFTENCFLFHELKVISICKIYFFFLTSTSDIINYFQKRFGFSHVTDFIPNHIRARILGKSEGISLFCLFGLSCINNYIACMTYKQFFRQKLWRFSSFLKKKIRWCFKFFLVTAYF